MRIIVFRASRFQPIEIPRREKLSFVIASLSWLAYARLDQAHAYTQKRNAAY